MRFKVISIFILSFLLSSCLVGPDYKRPAAKIPAKFKEAPKGWKIAQPSDDLDRGEWWKIFKDEKLNELECQLNTSNQNIKQAQAQFWQARAVVDEARAALYPTIAGVLSVFRQKSAAVFTSSSGITSTGISSSSSSSSGSSGARSGGGGSSSSSGGPITSYSLNMNATWEPDLWGSVRRTIEADAAGAQASAAQLASVRLSMQASLAQYYFELRGADMDQKILNDTVAGYKKSLKLTENRYAAGVAQLSDVVQARTQVESAEAQAINIGIIRAQYEHAIAVLVGVPASNFCLPPNPLKRGAPAIPLEVPCALLERRPDVAQAERLMKQANAQIGVALATFFPSLNLSGLGTLQGTGSIASWLGNQAGWAAGGQIAQTFLDGGLRAATVRAATANYAATVASYRETVLAAVQNVEDNIAALRLYKQQTSVLQKAAKDAELALKLVINQYKAGTTDFANVIVAQITAYTAEKNAADVNYLQMTSAVALIMALGGGWEVCSIKDAANVNSPEYIHYCVKKR